LIHKLTLRKTKEKIQSYFKLKFALTVTASVTHTG